MGKYGKYLRQVAKKEWADRYMDYKSLKHFIKEQRNLIQNSIQVESNNQNQIQLDQNQEENKEKNEIQNQDDQNKDENPPENKRLSKPDLLVTFNRLLDKELKKVYIFFIQSERELYVQINSRLHLRKSYFSFSKEQISKEFDDLISISNFTRDLTKYIKENIVGIQKILKKFDKKFQDCQADLKHTYIAKKLEMKNSDLLYIFQFKIVDEVIALVEVLKDDLYKAFIFISQHGAQKNLVEQTGPNENLMDNSYVPSELIEAKLKEVNSKLNEIEFYYSILRNIHKEWKVFLKEKSYQYESSNKTSLEIEKDPSLEGRFIIGKQISDANSWNLRMTYLQKFYMACLYTLIYSNNHLIVWKGMKKNPHYSSLVIGLTPVGGLVSFMVTQFFEKNAYKVAMILSSLFSIGGCLLYILGCCKDSLACLCIARFLIGFALNTRIHRSYILGFIPKRKISIYLFVFKMIFLLGNSAGPLITFLSSFFKETKDKSQFFLFTQYTTPTWICTFLGIILLVLIIIFYSEPTKPNFNPYAEGKAPLDEVKQTSTLGLEGTFTNKESESLKEINDKLSEFNTSNQYSDTNLVSSSIDLLMTKEKSKGHSVYIAYNLIITAIFFSNFSELFLLTNGPIIISELGGDKILEDKNSNRYIALMILLSFLIYIIMYYVNYKSLSKKLNKNIYGGVLSFLLAIGFVCILVSAKIDNNASKFIFGAGFVVNIICGYLLEDTALNLYTSVVPSDYHLKIADGPSLIICIRFLGMMIGSLTGLFSLINEQKTKEDEPEKVVFIIIGSIMTFALVVLGGFFLHYKEMLKEKAIRRIFRSKNINKYRRTEF